MKGKYRIYDGEELIAEFDNIITTEGRRVIGKFLASQKSSWSDSIAIGSGSSSPQVSNKSLDMEFWRDEIDLKSYKEDLGRVSLRSRIPASVVGKVHEIGVYYTPTSDGFYFSTPVLAQFDLSVETWDGGTSNTTDNRVGLGALQVAAGSSASLEFEGDLRTYNADSVFRLAYISDASVSSVTLRLKASDSDYREYSFSPSSPGYQVESWRLQDFGVIGNPQWSEIYELEILTVGTGNITFDAFSAIDEKPSDPLSILVSRALVDVNGQAFFQKRPQRELQVEYLLELNV